ncbi:OsmC family protein [Dechloromonas sp. ZY10]|uniref:OsmC family protein n=1 Tax=Dechloromonas aquae TaxID=2664436 RepID=UPI0035283D6A
MAASSVIVSENGRGRYQQTVCAGQHQLLADEPASMGGEDAGPAPFDYLLAALGACTSMTLRMYAERKDLPLEQVEVELRHDRIEIDGQLRDRIRRQITLRGDLNPEQRQRMLEIAGKCPIARALGQPLLLEAELAA